MAGIGSRLRWENEVQVYELGPVCRNSVREVSHAVEVSGLDQLRDDLLGQDVLFNERRIVVAPRERTRCDEGPQDRMCHR